MEIKRSLLVLSVFVLALGSSGVHAAVQVEDIEGSSIPAGLTDEQIQKTMQNAGLVRGWVIKPVASGHMEATIYVRSHMAKVDIIYDAATYSIRYNDSENLGYKDGRIHKNYNKWVQNLNMDIQRSFAMGL